MSREEFHDGRVVLHGGDCLDVLKELPPDSVDAVVTDPPYHLTSIVQRFGKPGSAECQFGSDVAFRRASAGFMGKAWDGGDVAFRPETWAEMLRVLKPGGHLVAFAAPKNSHRMVCAIEDAGFEIRDGLMWLFGSGFPKSHDVSKAIDKALGCERAKVRVGASAVRNPKATGGGRDGMEGATRPWLEEALARGYHEAVSDEAVSDEAVSWQGWGTALKPAYEPICLARKPIDGTVAANVLKHGTGAININGCRVGTQGGTAKSRSGDKCSTDSVGVYLNAKAGIPIDAGRWPANIVHDGSDEVVAAFPESKSSRSIVTSKPGDIFGSGAGLPSHTGIYGFNDSGSAARFFYSAKADANTRIGSKHPTVKPVDLMRWLVRLVTPPEGVVLDPFAGTGTTGEAAILEGFRAILIDREAEYQADIRRRMEHVFRSSRERSQTIVTAKAKTESPAPLFEVSQ